MEEKCKICGNEVFSHFRQQAYCRECFPKTCIHFFRASFGKNRLIRDGEKVLVSYSGGTASTAMIQLVKLGLGDGAVKKLRFVPFIFHLDERDIGSTVADPEGDFNVIRRTLEESGFENSILTYEKILPNVSLLPVIEARGEATARQALRHILRRKALLAAARRFECSRVLVGDTATRAAGLVLESVIQGRGAEVADSSAFADSRFSPTVVRPMLEFRESECAALARLFDLPTVREGKGPLTRTAHMGSLQGLTSRVLHDLEPSFPATNFSIIRTGAKIRESEGSLPRCRLCESAIDILEERDEESAVKDLQFSYERISGVQIMKDPSLCYGCQILAQKHPPLKHWLTQLQE